MPGWRNGSRATLKMLWSYDHAGSSPALGTRVAKSFNVIKLKENYIKKLLKKLVKSWDISYFNFLFFRVRIFLFLLY